MTDRTRPKLWTHKIKRADEPVYMALEYPDAHFKPFDIVLLRVKAAQPIWPATCCFVRLDRINQLGARKDRLTLTLEDTAMLEDTFEYYGTVLQQMEAQNIGHRLCAEMRPTDKTVERLYGAPDPHWYSVRLDWTHMTRHLVDSTPMKIATLHLVENCDETGTIILHKRNELEPLTSTRSCARLATIRAAEHKRWLPRRTIIIDGFTKRDGRLSMLTSFIHDNDGCIRTSTDWTGAEDYLVYYLYDATALFVFEQIEHVLLPALKRDGFTGRVELSRPGFVHRRVPGEKYADQVRDCMSLAYLRWQCCAAAKTLIALEMPIYVVLWITQWLPGMYRLTEIERLRLIESVYSSIWRVQSRRDEAEANKQRNKR